LAAINVLISSRTGKSKFSGAEKFPASLFPKPIALLTSFEEKREERRQSTVFLKNFFHFCFLEILEIFQIYERDILDPKVQKSVTYVT
jgi:hypothetical protein